MNFRSARCAVGLAVAIGLLAGCASATSTGGSAVPVSSTPAASAPAGGGASGFTGSASTSNTSGPIFSSASCPADLAAEPPTSSSAQTVPASITVSWVLRCTVVTKGTSRTLLTERSNSDPAALLAALRTPSGLRAKGVCPMYRPAVPYFGLVQANGQALIPKVPTTSCGQAQPAVLAALAKLQFSTLSSKALN